MLRYTLLVSFAGAASLACAEPLSFDAALGIATRSSPDIAVQATNVEAARSASIAAGRLPDPKLAIGIENLPVTGTEQWSLTRDFMTMRKIGVIQEIPNAAKRAAQAAAADAAVARAEAERRLRILAVRRDTALAWLDRYYLERRGTLLDELDRENQLFSQTVQAQLASGRSMPADTVAPKQEAAEIADRRDELAAQIAKSRAVLKRWVGSAAEEPLSGQPPALTLDSDHLREHVHEHPELAVFVPMTQVAQAEVHEAEATKRPDWGVELAYGRRGSAFSDMVSLQFTLELPLFAKTRQDPQIAAKRQELNRVELQRNAMLRDHTEELEADLAEYDVVTRQLARLRDVRLPLAREKLEYQFASYRAAKADLTSVLAARRELIDQRIKEIELESKHTAAAAKLYYFYGPGAGRRELRTGAHTMNASRQQLLGIALGAVILATISAVAGYWLAQARSESQRSVPPGVSGQTRKPLYWYDPMQPTQHFDKPGKSPFMDMQLVPMYVGEAGDGEAGIKIDPGIVQNLGVRTTEVERGSLAQPVDAVATIAFNQRDVAVIQARSSGFVTRMYARAPGDVISRDAPIVDLLVPEWAGAQTEFLALLKNGDRALIDAARERLVLLGMPSDLVERIENTREPRTTITIRSPLAGVIETLDVRDGMTVTAGAPLAKINGLATVWLEAAVPESQGALTQLGKNAVARLTAYPGQSFKGRVIAVLPQASAETHTVLVRIELANVGGRLRPGMFAQVRLDSGGQTPVLYVASEAVIHTGTRTVVIVAGERGRFTPVDVQAGAEVNGKTVILKGLTQGQRVVASGQFLIDSEARLQGVLAHFGGGNQEGRP